MTQLGDAEAAAFDVLGIGMGPSNLGLAIALHEGNGQNGTVPLRARFLEKQRSYRWHPGLMLPGARMQVSFLKDLVTQRNPTSDFSFISYLAAMGNLEDFINARRFHPLRREFGGYLRWVAERLSEYTVYGNTALDVSPVEDGRGGVRLLRVRTASADGDRELLCRNLVLGVGGRPRMVEGSSSCGGRVVHSSAFLDAVSRSFPDASRPYRFAVVGAGQSSIEMVLYLCRAFPSSTCDLVISRFGIRRSEASYFMNELFMNAATSLAYEGNAYVRCAVLDRSTNNGVVDEKEIDELYDLMYEQRLEGRKQVAIQRFCRLTRVFGQGDRVGAVVEDLASGERRTQIFDGVFLGTGFERRLDDPLLAGVAGYCRRDDAGRWRITRDFRLETEPGFQPGVYVQGASEWEHGIGTSLLSGIAFRAAEIEASIRGRLVDNHPARGRPPEEDGCASFA